MTPVSDTINSCEETYFDHPHPERFPWKGQSIEIVDIGRHWVTEECEHFLVRTANNQVFELTRSKEGALCHVKPIHLPPQPV